MAQLIRVGARIGRSDLPHASAEPLRTLVGSAARMTEELGRGGGQMATLTGPAPGTRAVRPAGDDLKVTRSLDAAYARARIEEVVRAVAEDALGPVQVDVVPWREETPFETDLRDAVREIADTANGLLAERLASLLETAPPGLAGRLASARGFSDLS
jgi:hypothetical protein